MHKNSIKRAGRVIFRKKSNYKKPETQPEPVMSNPNPTRTRRNISKPDPTQTRHLATQPITKVEFFKNITIEITIHNYIDKKK